MRRIGFLTLIAAGLIALAGVGGSRGTAQASAPAPDRETQRYEVRFLESMIDHHALAVAEASLCPGRATHAELLATCQNIVTSQSAQIQMMQSWLQDWYGISYTPQLTPGEMQQVEKLSSLTDGEFEVTFMETMIRHHKKAIREAEGCLKKAYHGELLDLCANIIASQAAEIVDMSDWLCSWYGICRYQTSAA